MEAINHSTHSNPGAFVRHAIELFEHGLAPVPTGGDNGKRPMIKGYNKNPLAPDTLYSMANDPRYSNSNIAIVCGHSNLNVVDVDDPKLLDPMLDRYGDTPLISQTAGRGGFHLFYKAAKGLGPCDFRHTEDIEVEIKAEGNIVMFPTSIHPETGKGWRFLRGGLSDLHRLPTIKTSTLDLHARSQDKASGIERGHRNVWLFKQCLREAPHCDSLDDLLDTARTRADELVTVRLTDSEVVSCAKSAWNYQVEGKNLVGRQARHFITRSLWREVLEHSSNGSDALALYNLLVMEHALRVGRGETFVLVVKGMVKAETIPHWGVKRYRAAIRDLLELNLISMVHRGRGPGNPSQYKLIPTPSLKISSPVFCRDQIKMND